MVNIAGLDHLVLTVADIEATAGFYERLGMRREMFDGDRVALHFGQQKINLHQVGSEFEPHAEWPGPGSADFCLLVAGSIEQVLRELSSAGIPAELGPVDRTGRATPASIRVRPRS